MNEHILIVDDDRTERRIVTSTLKSRFDFNIIEAVNGKEALEVLKSNRDIKLVILDLDMPVMDGRHTLKKIIQKEYKVSVIVVTGSKNMDDAVQAMKDGAYDFLSKPVEPERLSVCVRNALKNVLMTKEIEDFRNERSSIFKFSNLIGHDNDLIDSIAIGKKAAASNLPALITGETGTGKEIFSKAIHGESSRKNNPFIAVNCGAIPENLVESTLFGHEKGSFTGAINKSIGKFQEANNGTIFLDEIGELPLEAQVKLLRALQQQEVEPVGAARPVAVDVRVISATNRNLVEEIHAGRFREDLYFRLNVLHIELPPLRKRKNDIIIMIQHFIHQFCETHKVKSKTLTRDAVSALECYHWPGNVRELENVINRAMVLSEGNIIELSDLKFMGNPTSEGSDGLINPLQTDGSFKNYKDLEKEIFVMALEYHKGNITQTARTLGVSKSTVYTKTEASDNIKTA